MVEWASTKIGKPVKYMISIVSKRDFNWLGLNLTEMKREEGKL